MLIIVFITSSIGGFAVYASSKYLERNTRDLSLQVLQQYSENMDNHAKSLINTSVYLLSDDAFRSIISEGTLDTASDNYPIFRSQLEALLLQYGNSHPSINFIGIRTNSGKSIWWENKKGASRTKDVNYFNEVLSSEAVAIEQAGIEIAWHASTRMPNEVLMSRKFINLNNVNQSLGTLVFGIDSTYFLSMESNSSLIRKENLVILNEEGSLLASGGTTIVDDKSGQSMNSSFLLVREYMKNLDWQVLCYIPKDILYANKHVLTVVIILVSLVALVISSIFAFYFSVSTTSLIKKLEQAMKLVEKGDFDVHIEPAGQDEIGSLTIRFNFMIARIRELINTVYKERLAKQQAEFSVLLCQINPHFLYNTLGTVKWYAHMKQQNDIVQMMNAIINLLKSSVRRENEYHPLSEEINHIRDYIYIQKIGYGEAIEVHYEIDPEVMPAYVPYFALQPLVENAILHGLEMSKGNGLITIHAYREGQALFLLVEDNGIGMNAKKVEHILHRGDRKGLFSGLTSIGIRSVHERIQLYYGCDYGLSYESVEGSGTKARIRLPFILNLREAENYA
ncbi:cache domain-containing sensor histidine kinase [Paenibacillus silvestris]|uniref:cache domain-containing sensor histidine kinase n=1 Tax=Paenibacillus silvestris TaxID=2606219 RepID=UPI0013733133|nr:histidine kinase [Paenibacillus silvestris]